MASSGRFQGQAVPVVDNEAVAVLYSSYCVVRLVILCVGSGRVKERERRQN